MADDAKSAGEFNWTDKTYAAWRKTIADATVWFGSCGTDADSVAKAKAKRKEVADALSAMKQNDDCRRKIESLMRDLDSLDKELDESQAKVRKNAKNLFDKSESLADDARRRLDEGRFVEAEGKLRSALANRREAIARGYLSMAQELLDKGVNRGDWAKAIAVAEKVPADAASRKTADEIQKTATEKIRQSRIEDERELADVKKRVDEAAKKRLEYSEWEDPPYASTNRTVIEVLVALEGLAGADDLPKAKEIEKTVGVALAWMEKNGPARKEANQGELSAKGLRGKFLEKYGTALSSTAISDCFSNATVSARDAEVKRDAGDYAGATKGFAAASRLYVKAGQLAEREWTLARISEMKESLSRYDELDREKGLGNTDPATWARAEKARQDGEDRLKKGDIDEAENLFKSACEILDTAYPSMKGKKAETIVISAKEARDGHRWKACLSLAREALKWNPGNAEAATLEREARVLIEPENDERFFLKIGDIRDKTGKTTNSIELAYSKGGECWQSVAPISQGQWLSIARAPMRFRPEDDSRPANFINQSDVREWLDKLGRRPECADWTFSFSFYDGSMDGEARNHRTNGTNFRIGAVLSNPDR